MWSADAVKHLSLLGGIPDCWRDKTIYINSLVQQHEHESYGIALLLYDLSDQLLVRDQALEQAARNR